MIRYLLLLALALPASAGQFSVLLDDALLPCTVGADRVPRCASHPVTPVGPISCPGFTQTEVMDVPIPLKRVGPQPVKRFSKNVTGDKALVIRFVAPPSGLVSLNVTGTVGTEQVQRVSVMSATPCDFAGASASSHPAYRMSEFRGQQRYTYAPGKVYYINLRHVVRLGPANVVVTVTNT